MWRFDANATEIVALCSYPHGAIDGGAKREPAVVVRVIADDIDASRRTHDERFSTEALAEEAADSLPRGKSRGFVSTRL